MQDQVPSRWKKQIDGLLKKVPQVIQVGKNFDHWQIQAIDSHGQPNFSIHLQLDSSFPSSPPAICVIPQHFGSVLRHPWVSQDYYIIGHPRYNNWSSQTSLGTMMTEILEEFKTKPPRIFFPTDFSAGGYPSPPQISKTRLVFLPIPLQFDALSNKTFEELQELFNNEPQLDSLIYDHREAQSALNYLVSKTFEIDSIYNELASFNESIKTHMKKIKDLEVTVAINLEQLQESVYFYNSFSSPDSPSYLNRLLNQRAQQVSMELNELAHDRESKAGASKAMANQYLELRRQLHKMSAMKEKIQ